LSVRLEMQSIHITRWGQSGPRVILVHGGAQGSGAAGERNFAAQRPLADRGFQLIVPDRPAHGRSPDPGRPDDAEADGQWVAELLEGGSSSDIRSVAQLRWQPPRGGRARFCR